jgi:signal transduction histidine kinase
MSATSATRRIWERLDTAVVDGTAWVVGRDGTFLLPPEPAPFASPSLPEDAPTDFVLMIEDAERMETLPGEEGGAAALYRLAAAESESEPIRRLALYRLAALEGRRGRTEEAALAWTELMPLAGDTELLLLAAVEGAPVPREKLVASLCRHLGSRDRVKAEGYGRLLGRMDDPAVTTRLTELRLMDELRTALPHRPATGPVCFLPLGDDHAAFVRERAMIVVTTAELQAILPPGAVPPGGTVPPERPGEMLETSKGPAGFVFSARADRRVIDDAVIRQTALLLSATVVATVAGFIAIFTLLKGVRRRAELAHLKSEFVANVSHELRTPLSVIRLYAETLRAGRVPEGEEQEYAEVIEREAAALTGLVDRVLAFSGIDRGTRTYRPAPGDLAAFLRRTAEDSRARRPSLELDVEETGAPDPAEFDAEALTIAIGNLLDNAAKHGSGTALLRLVPDGPRLVRIEVLDRGPGVPEDERGKLFERFHRGRSAREAGIRGSGLGLALVRHAAEGHGGNAGFEPRPGGGSIFYLTLPVEEET